MTENNRNTADIHILQQKSSLKDIYPVTYTSAVYDDRTGANLTALLHQFNNMHLPYAGTSFDTRNQLPEEQRRKGIIISYVDLDGDTITEQCVADKSTNDEYWGLDENWRKLGDVILSGELSVSSKGTWVINGEETNVKAVGPKGDNGATPMLKTINNKLHYSYDGTNWVETSENIAAWFRWNTTTADTQANKLGRLQISRDNGTTWTTLSGDITNNLHISKYIGADESLPTSGIAEGTIYAKGPYYEEGDTLHDNPIYRLWVYAWKGNTLAWQDNGEFTGIAAGVVQETGDSETEVMSQKAVTEKLSELGSVTKDFNVNRYIKELYLHGIDKSSKYVIETIANETTSRYVYIKKVVENETDIRIAGAYTTDLTSDIIEVTQRNDSGVNGYIVCNWDIIPEGESYFESEIWNEYVSNIVYSPYIKSYLDRQFLEKKFIVSGDNGGYSNVTIANNKIIFGDKGICIKELSTKSLYYVAYVDGEDESDTYVIEGTSSTRTWYVIDTKSLVKNKRCSFAKGIKKITNITDIQKDDIIIAEFYYEQLVHTGEMICELINNYHKDALSYSNYNFVYNRGYDNISIVQNKIIIKPSGFGLIFNNTLYYVASVDMNRTENYVFEFSGNGVLVLDVTALVNVDKRNEVENVIKIVSRADMTKHIILAYYYDYYEKLVAVGQFKDFFVKDVVANKDININSVLFEPEFYAYKQGKILNEYGEGEDWFNRFCIFHVSDIHQYNELYKESIIQANTKANLFINTGDDANGIAQEDASKVKNELTASTSVVKENNVIPFIQTIGNHDITGLTKKEYFDLVGNTVSLFSNKVVWGDSENYRMYGYIDFTDDSYRGNFRVIMLDPADYDDGMYQNPYPNATVIFSQKQIDWLIAVLKDAASNNFHVITTMHYSFGDRRIFNEDIANPDASYMQDAFMIPDIIDAIQNKLVLNKTYAELYGNHNVTINEDFTSVGTFKYIAHIFGHIHSKNVYQCQKSDGSKKYDMLMLGESAIGKNGIALDKVYKRPNTANNIAFSSICIDIEEESIYRTSYGAFLRYDNSNYRRTEKYSYRF